MQTAKLNLQMNDSCADGYSNHKVQSFPRPQVKNVGSDELAGKVGRIYIPSQDVGNMALRKMKVRAYLVNRVICRRLHLYAVLIIKSCGSNTVPCV